MLVRRPLALSVFALLVAAWIVVSVTTGVDAGLPHLAPAVALGAPLLLGRYVGERRLAALASRSRATSRVRGGRIPMPRSHVRLMRRGGRLVASSLAKRPPPPPAQQLHA